MKKQTSGSGGMDKGPWCLLFGPHMKIVGIVSDDEERNVVLQVDGEFSSGGEKYDYCLWLINKLNGERK